MFDFGWHCTTSFSNKDLKPVLQLSILGKIGEEQLDASPILWFVFFQKFDQIAVGRSFFEAHIPITNLKNLVFVKISKQFEVDPEQRPLIYALSQIFVE